MASNLKTILGERRTYSDVAYTHAHNYAQLIIPLQGSLFIETAQQQLEVDDSRLFFLPPDCRHTFFAKATNEFLVLDVPGQLVFNRAINKLSGGVGPSFDEQWQALRFLLLAEINQSQASGQPLLDLFSYAYHLLTREQVSPSIAHIHRHFHQPLTVQRLAQIEGYNLTYYCEWFKKQTGQTPQTYIQMVRLNQAKQLLVETDLSILQIAQQVGYDHHASLTRLFRQQLGITPLAYRRHTRK